MSMLKQLRLAVGAMAVLGGLALARAQTYSIADYFPLAPNSHWTLADVTNPSPGDDDGFTWTVLGAGPQSVPPHTVWKVHTDANENTDAREDDIDFWNYYDSSTKLGLYGLHKGTAINYIPGNQDIVLSGPLKMGDANMAVGWVGTSSATATVNTTLGPLGVTFNSTVTLDRHLDTLTTDMGTFADVIVLVVNVKASLLIYQVDFLKNTFWLARGVGLVRQNQTLDPDDAQYQELASGMLNGVAITATGGTTHTVTYLAGANGHIDGPTPQTVADGADSTEVTASAEAGYHFVDWSDGRVDNPRQDTNVTADITVTANFAADEPAGSTIAGRITRDGVGLAGVTLALASGGTAVSDANGHYAFTDLADGTYQVVPAGGGTYAFTPPLRLVGVPPSVTAADFVAQSAGGGLLVPGSTAIYLAGRDDLTVPPLGVDPATVGFPLGRDCVGTCPVAVLEGFPVPQTAAPGDTFTFSATGGVDYYGGTAGVAGPDGYPSTDSAIDPLAGISGYNGPNGSLVGVFLSAVNPVAQGSPSGLDFSTGGLGTSFATLAPGLGQVFFIGDGNSGAKAAQTFTAPAGTTRLFLGIADGFSFSGAPGAYDDDIGAFVVTVNRTPAVVTHTVTYLAGANGHIEGDTPQTVTDGADSTAVTAVAAGGYHFVDWSDGRNDNPRQDTNVTADITVTANFAADEPTGSTIGGRITLDGAGLPGITVALVGGGTAASDANGYYAFTDLADGTYQVIPAGAGLYAFTPPLRLVAVPPSTADADFAAQSAGSGLLVAGPTAI